MRHFLLIAIAVTCFACSVKINPDKEMSTKKKIKLADQLFQQGSYYNAIDYYEEAMADETENIYVAHQLADLYWLSRDYANSEKYYRKVLELDENRYELARLHYAKSLKMNAKYELAKTEYTAFQKKYRGADRTTYRKYAKNEIAGCDMAIDAMKNPLPTRIKHLNTNVNAAYTDYAAIPLGDTAIMFSSMRSDSVIEVDNLNKNTVLSRIYTIKSVRGQVTGPRMPMELFNDDKVHTGHGSYSADGKSFYFTKCTQTAYATVKCAIYVSVFDSLWQEPRKLPSAINNPSATTTQPNLGLSKKGDDVLYFVSDRPGGEGGMDVWYSVLSRGKYKDPINLGRKINTKWDERTPFYDIENQILYFSSNGRIGFGGFDIYKSEGNMRAWSAPENVGYPLNSSVDDMYFTVDKDGKRGYFTSNRIGSIALKSPTCCDDIYQYDWTRIIKVAVEGYVFEEGDSTMTPLDASRVDLSVHDNATDEEVVLKYETTADGLKYFFNLSLNKDYNLSASKQGYFSGKGFFKDYIALTTKGITRSITLRVDLYLKKIEKNVGYEIQNIYYDFDKANLRDRSKKSLDSLVIILNEHPEIEIEIGAHTDSRGTDIYNANLSQKRAESVVKYLITHGVSRNRLVAKGYGESELKEDCSVYSECPDDSSGDCPCHQRNRRTEFKVIGELENVIITNPDDEDF